MERKKSSNGIGLFDQNKPAIIENDDPFKLPKTKPFSTMARPKVTDKQILNPAVTGGEWFTVQGNPPAKSNCYVIIPIRKKNEETGKVPRGYIMGKAHKLTKYEKDFGLQAVKFRNRHIDAPFTLNLHVYFERSNSDLDNSLKIILDCLQMVGMITNDKLCHQIHATKFVDKQEPRIEFMIEPVNSQ